MTFTSPLSRTLTRALTVVQVVVKAKTKFIARLSLEGQASALQALNLSLFATADDAPESLPAGASPLGGAPAGLLDAARPAHEKEQLSR